MTSSLAARLPLPRCRRAGPLQLLRSAPGDSLLCLPTRRWSWRRGLGHWHRGHWAEHRRWRGVAARLDHCTAAAAAAPGLRVGVGVARQRLLHAALRA
eukprot:CAMPEP_0179986208 /NCGR_PEP_ID=MMETSP0984-20121128/2107_1 /TAXON_ID=483367 /ORGANISM="non described non described, Strain CCMP 2436" /LENGTH=97 /DNA_ID=CAMNT_0021904973 /DNA_START=18 /DNA_END=307 /DNA_ORIENTATION=+